jgi:hypothetical protein
MVTRRVTAYRAKPDTHFVIYSNNSSPSLIVTLTPTGCMMPWSKLGGIFQVYMKFLH